MIRSGAMYDMAAITAGAHDRGALVQWDLCHSTGAVPVALAASSVFGLLRRTAEKGAREILLIEAQNEFIAPSKVFTPERL